MNSPKWKITPRTTTSLLSADKTDVIVGMWQVHGQIDTVRSWLSCRVSPPELTEPAVASQPAVAEPEQQLASAHQSSDQIKATSRKRLKGLAKVVKIRRIMLRRKYPI
jgi:hypothetical protein